MDEYFVYRPMLELFGKSEGTAPPKGRGYNETLGYGAYTGGPVNLVSMTLDQVDQLQTKMLQHPKNKWNSSAAGMYQIVRTTRRSIQEALKIPGSMLFNADMQDRMACYLLGVRGIDKWLAGRLSEETLINNLAQEWASIPKTTGQAHYQGQGAGVRLAEVRAALAETKRRHVEGQPQQVAIEVPVEVEKPVVPVAVENEVRKTTNWLSGGLFSGFTFAGFGGWITGMNWQSLLLVAGIGAFVVLAVLLFGEWGVRRIRNIRKALAE